MKIGDLARRAGVSAHTIRYYEKIGLLEKTGRDAGGRRDYDTSFLTWLEFLGRLKTTGMPIRDMLRYAAFRDEGAGTERQRHDLLVEHRQKVLRDIEALQNNLTVLDMKIATYAQSLEETTENDDAKHQDSKRKRRAL